MGLVQTPPRIHPHAKSAAPKNNAIAANLPQRKRPPSLKSRDRGECVPHSGQRRFPQGSADKPVRLYQQRPRISHPNGWINANHLLGGPAQRMRLPLGHVAILATIAIKPKAISASEHHPNISSDMPAHRIRWGSELSKSQRAHQAPARPRTNSLRFARLAGRRHKADDRVAADDIEVHGPAANVNHNAVLLNAHQGHAMRGMSQHEMGID